MNRITKSTVAAKPAVNAKVEPKVKQTAAAEAAKPVAEDDGVDSMFAGMIRDSFREITGFEVPSWKRTLVALVATLTVSIGIGYAASTMLSWLMAGALAMAVPYFIAFVVYALGFLLACWFGARIAARIGGAIISKSADEQVAKTYGATKRLLAKMNPFSAPVISAA